jgi:hypothetical protein
MHFNPEIPRIALQETIPLVYLYALEQDIDLLWEHVRIH